MRKSFLIIISLLSLILLSGVVLAQVQLNDAYKPSYAPSIVIENGNEADYGNYFLQLLAGGLLYLAAPVAVIVIAIAGLLYVTSRGDQNQMDKAKKTLTWAIIGLMVIIFSYTIVRSVIEIVYNTNKPIEQNQSSAANQNSSNGSGETTKSTGL